MANKTSLLMLLLGLNMIMGSTVFAASPIDLLSPRRTPDKLYQLKYAVDGVIHEEEIQLNPGPNRIVRIIKDAQGNPREVKWIIIRQDKREPRPNGDRVIITGGKRIPQPLPNQQFAIEQAPQAIIQAPIQQPQAAPGALIAKAPDAPAPGPTALLGDLNNDGIVDRADVAILARNFGRTTGATPEQGDMNGDGAINLLDLMLLQQRLGSTGTDTTPPVTTANPPGGVFQTSVAVTLTADEPATIYYTTNGLPPTTSSTIYTGPILITTDRTLRFFAVDTAGNAETPQSILYERYAGPTNIAAGTISANTTWRKKFSPYILQGDVRFAGTPTVPAVLTIEPGVEVRIPSLSRLIIGTGSNLGAMSAIGTPAEPILFTSTGAGVFHRGVFFADASVDAQTITEHCIFENGGNTSFSDAGNINITGASPTIRNCIIRQSQSRGIYLASSSAPLIENNLFTENSFAAATLDLSSGQAVFTGNSYQNNARDTIDLRGGVYSSSGTLKKQDTVYRCTTTVIIAGSSSTPSVLTLEPGVRMTFSSNQQLVIGSGSNLGALRAIGTDEDPILFTSTSSNNYWAGLYFANATVDNLTVVQHCILERGGTSLYFNSGNISMQGANPTISDTIIRQSETRGIYMDSGSAPNLSRMMITDNPTGIHMEGGARPVMNESKIVGNGSRGFSLYGYNGNPQPVVRRNSIYNNGQFDVATDAFNPSGSSVTVDFTENWWGTTDPAAIDVRIRDDQDGSGRPRVLYMPILDSENGNTGTSIQLITTPETAFSPAAGSALHFNLQLSEPANWTISIRNNGGQEVRALAASNRAQWITEWDGKDSAGETVPDGDYTWTVAAAAVNSQTLILPLTRGVVVDTVIDDARIAQPLANAAVYGDLAIRGAADDRHLASWSLQYGIGSNPASWLDLASGVNAVPWDGTGQPPILFTWNTRFRSNGSYVLRLRAYDTAGNSGEALVPITIHNVSINGAAALDTNFSPNADGVQDLTRINASITAVSNWTLTFNGAGGQPVRTFTGQSNLINILWDGRDSSGDVVPDGSYTWNITAQEILLGQSAAPATGTVIVDTVAPSADISSPSDGQEIVGVDLPVIGTANDTYFNNYVLEYTAGAAPAPSAVYTQLVNRSTPVTNNSLYLWSDITEVANGAWTLRLRVDDQAGNRTTVTRVLNINNIQITNVSRAPVQFDPTLGQTVTLEYDLDRPAQVSVKLREESTDAVVKVIVNQETQSQGHHAYTWDGTDDQDALLPLQSAYYLTIEASDGSGKVDKYVPAVPESDFANSPTPTSFNPFANELFTINFTLTNPARLRMDAQIDNAFEKTIAFEPFVGVSEKIEWDGRKADGRIIDPGTNYRFYQHVPAPLPQNVIITRNLSVRVDNLKANAYVIQPILGETSRVSYSLPYELKVTVNIKDPNGSHYRTLVESEIQAAGEHSFFWDGTNEDGDYVSVPGHYTLEFLVENPAQTNAATRLGNVTVWL